MTEVRDSNLFMTFRYNGSDHPTSFGYIINQKSFETFVAYGHPLGVNLREEDVKFPDYLMNGSTRRALVHLVDGARFACYVPVFPTQEEVETYNAAFRR